MSSSNFLLGLFLETMFNKQIASQLEKIRKLNGDPHYVALGLGLGVFIAITPTIPFHTLIALILAVLLRASKPAVILGIWVSNPITVIPFYFACYKTGSLFFGSRTGAAAAMETLIHHLESEVSFSEKLNHLALFLNESFDIFIIMNLGGLILGIPAGILTYGLALRFFRQIRSVRQKGETL